VKFGYTAEGKLVPIEELELRARLGELEARLDNRSPADRAEDVERLKDAFASAREPLSGEDENVLSLYRDGVIDFHNLEHHFGTRLPKALARQMGARDGAA